WSAMAVRPGELTLCGQWSDGASAQWVPGGDAARGSWADAAGTRLAAASATSAARRRGADMGLDLLGEHALDARELLGPEPPAARRGVPADLLGRGRAGHHPAAAPP